MAHPGKDRRWLMVDGLLLSVLTLALPILRVLRSRLVPDLILILILVAGGTSSTSSTACPDISNLHILQSGTNVVHSGCRS